MTHDRLRLIGEAVRDIQDRVRQLSLVESEDAEIHALVARAQRKSARRRRLLRVTALVGVSAVLVLALTLWPRPRQLRCEVDGVVASANSWIAAGPAQRATLTFSDGSRIELEPSTRARVVELESSGARVILETGLAGLRIAERARASFTLSAGPFEIRLGAAHCDVLWEPDLESLEVVAYEGRARVSGPVVGEGRVIERGQRLSVGVREQRATLSTIDSVEFAGVPLPPAGMDLLLPPEAAPSSLADRGASDPGPSASSAPELAPEKAPTEAPAPE